MVSKQVCDRASNEKKNTHTHTKKKKNGCLILHVTCEAMKMKILFSRDFNFIRTGKNDMYSLLL